MFAHVRHVPSTNNVITTPIAKRLSQRYLLVSLRMNSEVSTVLPPYKGLSDIYHRYYVLIVVFKVFTCHTPDKGVVVRAAGSVDGPLW